MGYSTRNNGQIRDFWPDNDQNTLYLTDEHSFSDLLQKAKEYFGERFDEEKLSVSSEYIHTHCLTYDLYDSGDYTRFLVIRLRND